MESSILDSVGTSPLLLQEGKKA